MRENEIMKSALQQQLSTFSVPTVFLDNIFKPTNTRQKIFKQSGHTGRYAT